MTVGRSDTGKTTGRVALALAFAVTGTLFAYRFFQAGRDSLTPDGIRYLAAAQGETVDLPYNSRIVGPVIVSLVARSTGLSAHAAFDIVTAISLLASMLLLVFMLERRGAAVGYQVAVVLASGSAYAVFYGSYPVLVDGILLLLTCLLILALDYDRLALALVAVCVAALTKEYGALLALPWAVHARKRSKIYVAALLPFALVIGAALLSPARPGVYTSHEAFVISQLKYQAFWLYPEYFFSFLKLAYFWAWGAAWPLLLFSVSVVLNKFVSRSALTMDEMRFLAVLVACPILLTGDWDRTFMLVTPFACITAMASPLTRELRFTLLLGAGGLATSMARSYYFSSNAGNVLPGAYKVVPLTVGIAASALLAIIWCRESIRILRAEREKKN